MDNYVLVYLLGNSYKIGLFVGFNEIDLIEGTFNITGKTKVIGDVSIGSSVITVDSTVGFGQTGTLISGISTNIYYSDKSVNQFYGCENIVDNISNTDDIRSDEFYYGYENGDLTKSLWDKLYERLFGGFYNLDDYASEDENEIDELDEYPDEMKTTSGYLKDGFVVSDEDDEEFIISDDEEASYSLS